MLNPGESGAFAFIEHIPFETYEIHPQYNPDTNENDLWMIKLQWPSELYANSVVNLDTPTDSVILTPGDNLRVMGFGRLWPQGQLPNTLQKVTLEHISKDHCVNDHGYNAADITHDMFCAGNVNGEGTCKVRIRVLQFMPCHLICSGGN